MHAQHNLEKYLKQLQEDTTKKYPDISRECEEMLVDIANNNEMQNDCLVFEKKYFKPFVDTLKVKYKPDAYVYETIYFYIANNFIDEDLVKTLIPLLIKHYNENKEHGIRIMQSFYPLIRYDCVYGEILYNIFYCFICEVKSGNVKNNVLQRSAMGMCNQIVSNVLVKVGKTKEKVYYEDCKYILNDILEYMKEKNNKNGFTCCVSMSLDFVECCLKNKAIFQNEELRVTLYKIFDRMIEIKIEGKEVGKVNKILAKIYKEDIFIDYSIKDIGGNEDVVILYDNDLYEMCLVNDKYIKEVLNTVEKYLKTQNIENEHKLTVYNNIHEFIQNKKCDATTMLEKEDLYFDTLNNKINNEKNDENISDIRFCANVEDLSNNKHDKSECSKVNFYDIHCKTNDNQQNSNVNVNKNLKYIIKFFILNFYEFITSSKTDEIKENETVKKIIEFIFPFIIKHKNILYKYFSFCAKINAEFLNICIKLCVKHVSEVKKEWRIIFENIKDYNNTNLTYLLDESLKFDGEILYRLFSSVRDINIMYSLYTKNLERMYYNMSCVIESFNCIYKDTYSLSTLILEYYKNMKESDECIETLPLMYMYSKLNKSSVTEIQNKSDLKCFKEYLSIKQILRMTDEDDSTMIKTQLPLRNNAIRSATKINEENQESNYKINNEQNREVNDVQGQILENIANNNQNSYDNNNQISHDNNSCNQGVNDPDEDKSVLCNINDTNYDNNTYNQDVNIILATLHNILRIVGDRIQYSWNVILNIIELNISECIEINLQILQIIIEDYFYILTDENRIKAIKLLVKLDKRNEEVNVTLQILNILNEVKNMQSNVNNWKEYICSLLDIIKKEKTNWHNIFESGMLIVFYRSEKEMYQDNIKNDNKTENNSEMDCYSYKNKNNEKSMYFYENVLPEILALTKNIFYDKLLNENLSYEEKKKNKETFLKALRQMNEYIKNDYERKSECFVENENKRYSVVIHFMQNYYAFIKNLICYNYNLHERGYKTWKDEIFDECVKCMNLKYIDSFSEIYLSILESVKKGNNCKIYCNEANTDGNSKSTNDDNNSNTVNNSNIGNSVVNDNFVYSTKFCIEILNIALLINFNENSYDKFIECVFMFSECKEIRNVIFSILDKSKYKNKVLKQYCKLLIESDEDMSLRVIKSIYNLFLYSTIVKKNVERGTSNDITQHKDEYLYISKNEIQNLFNALIVNNNYEQVINCIILIGRKIKHDFVLVNEYIKACCKILKQTNPKQDANAYKNNNTSNAKQNNFDMIRNEVNNDNLVTFYGCFEEKKKDTMITRKKTSLLVMLVQEYIEIVSMYFYMDNVVTTSSDTNESNTGNIDENFSNSDLIGTTFDGYKENQNSINYFYRYVFSVIFENSFVFVDENLAYKCLKILFRYSDLIHDALVRRIKISLIEYVNEVSVYRELYSRTKRNEIHFIFDNLVENKNLINSLKKEIIECLETKDFYVIEKVKECLLRTM